MELAEVEVALLSALARAPEQRLAHWQLLEILRSDLDGASTANLAVRMTRLRKKLCDAGFDGATLSEGRASFVVFSFSRLLGDSSLAPCRFGMAYSPLKY